MVGGGSVMFIALKTEKYDIKKCTFYKTIYIHVIYKLYIYCLIPIY